MCQDLIIIYTASLSTYCAFNHIKLVPKNARHLCPPEKSARKKPVSRKKNQALFEGSRLLIAPTNSHAGEKYSSKDDLKQKFKKNLLSNYNYYMCKEIWNQQARSSTLRAGSS